MDPNLSECDSVVGLAKKILEKDEKRIAICGWAFNGSGGDCRVMEQQARDLVKAGYEVTIFALEADLKPPEGAELIVIGCPQNFYLSRIYRLMFPLNIFKVLEYAKKLGKFNLVIAHRYPATSLAYLAKKLYGVKYVYWFHYYPNVSLFSNPVHRLWLRIIRYLEVKALSVRGADVVCSVSKASAKILKEKGRLDSIVVPNKADIGRFKRKAEISKLRNKYGIKQNERIILFVGRITPQKNIHSLIQVFKSVNQIIPNLKLIIVGNPSVKEYFEKLKELANENVIFTGYVPDEELSGFYSICDVYATCSLSEGWNLPPAEAQSFGKPVIAFNTPEQREVVRKGYLVEPENYEEFKEKLIEVLNR